MTQIRSYLDEESSKHSAALWVSLLLLTINLLFVPARAGWHGDARPLMGTEVRVYLWHESEAVGNTLVEQVFREAERINQMMSTYIDTSVISVVNRDAAVMPVVATPELFAIVERALDIAVLTQGAFDITYDSVGQHYDFREGKRPDQAVMEAEKARIDYRFVTLNSDATTIFFEHEGVRINLGGIAKGYVVERGIDILRSAGLQHAIVTAGGDSRLLGDRRGRPWMIGIRDPRADGQVAISVPLEDEAISTSGDYERYFEEDGVRYHHILSPASGAPATGIRSATVFGPDAVMADALSTSVFVMGVDKGLKLIGCLPDYESIVIDEEGRIYYSSGLEDPRAPIEDVPVGEPVPGLC